MAPVSWVLFGLAYGLFLFSDELASWVGVERRDLLGGALARGAIIFGLAAAAIAFNRWWLVRTKRLQPGDRFDTKPETLIGIPLLLAGFLLPNLLGTRGFVSWLIVLGSLFGFVLLMLRADLKEPERRAAAREARDQGWSGPFE